MATKKTTTKKATAKRQAPRKLTHEELSRASVKHFPKAKAAAEKALRDAGVGNLKVHSMLFRAGGGLDPCQGKCAENETCMVSSTGEYVCVPNR